MAKLIIRRKKELVNSMRNVELILDSTVFGTIGNGKTEVFDIEPGTYKFRAQIDWCGSRVQEIAINEGEVKTIELSSYKYSNIVFPVLIFSAVFGFILSNFIHPDLSNLAFIIFIPGVLYMLYHITFGKDRYLQLNPVIHSSI